MTMVLTGFWLIQIRVEVDDIFAPQNKYELERYDVAHTGVTKGTNKAYNNICVPKCQSTIGALSTEKPPLGGGWGKKRVVVEPG